MRIQYLKLLNWWLCDGKFLPSNEGCKEQFDKVADRSDITEQSLKVTCKRQKQNENKCNQSD